MNSVVRHFSHLFLLLVVVVCSFPAQAAYQFTNIDYPGAVATDVWGINNSGQVVGSAQFADGSSHGFIYDSTNGGFTPLPATMSGYDLGFSGINQSGVTVGVAVDTAGHERGFILDTKGGFTVFSHPGFDNTEARGVGTSGLVTGWAFSNPDKHGNSSSTGFIYDPANHSFTDFLSLPPGPGSNIAQGINSQGQVVGGTFMFDGPGGPAADPRYGYLRDAVGDITLFQVNGYGTRARGITDSGLITGFVIVPGGIAKGFVGSLSGVLGFQLMVIPDTELLVAGPGAVSTTPQGIGNSGQIVGSWIEFVAIPKKKATTRTHGFIATRLPK